MSSKKVIYRIYFYLSTMSNNMNKVEFLDTACIAGLWAVCNQIHEVTGIQYSSDFFGYSLFDRFPK